MTDWWYWALFLGAVILIGAFRKQDERDRELWERFFGGRP